MLSTAVGNSTRYLIFKKYASREADIDFTWAPVKHFLAPDERDPFKFLTGRLKSRAITLLQAWPVLGHLQSFDALLIHMYEVDILTCLRSYLFRMPLRIVNTDDAPIVDPTNYPVYPHDRDKPLWKQKVRLSMDMWRARRADFLIPFSKWAADIHVRLVGISGERVVPVHVGIDLEHWTMRPAQPVRDGAIRKPILLFVAGEFERKGGNLLLEVFERRFGEMADLHIVSNSAPTVLPRNVYVHENLNAVDNGLKLLYQRASILVHPTTCDLSSWVVLEAMASGCAVITTRMAGITELVDDGISGLIIPPGNGAALEEALQSLLPDSDRMQEMGRQGRLRVEQHFNAALNVPKILNLMKRTVDKHRGVAVGPSAD